MFFYLKSVKNDRKSVEQLEGKQTFMIKILFRARLDDLAHKNTSGPF
jgi:hypothetical protein